MSGGQRPIKVLLLSKSLKGEEIAQELSHVLSTEYSIGTNNLLAAMRDRVSSSGVAMKTLKVLYPNLVDIGCFSHTSDRVGEIFYNPILHEFGIAWVSMFSHSPNQTALEGTDRKTNDFLQSYKMVELVGSLL